MATLKRNWPITAHRVHAYERRTLKVVAVDDLDILSGEAITINANGFADRSKPADKVHGISITKKTFEPTNETKEKASVIYEQVEDNNTYLIHVDGGTMDQAKVGKYFTVVSQLDHRVDLWSEDPAVGQFRCVGFLSETIGEFEVVRLFA
jgi:hypothetical protein